MQVVPCSENLLGRGANMWGIIKERVSTRTKSKMTFKICNRIRCTEAKHNINFFQLIVLFGGVSLTPYIFRLTPHACIISAASYTL